MKRVNGLLLFLTIVSLSAWEVQGATLGFEVVPPGSSIPISPQSPYTEAGFTISVMAAFAAVFDAAHADVDMPGNLTDFFGFNPFVTPTLTFTGGSFNIDSLLMGPISIPALGPTDILITGTLSAGGTLTASFTGLTTATMVNLNWSGLSSVRFSATRDSGLDNIVVTPSTVPESSSLTLLALGFFGLGIVRSRHMKA